MKELVGAIESFGANPLAIGILAIFTLLSAVEFTARYLLQGARVARWVGSKGSRALKRNAAIGIESEVELIKKLHHTGDQSQYFRNVQRGAWQSAFLTLALILIALAGSFLDSNNAPIWIGTGAGLATRRVFEVVLAVFSLFRIKRILRDTPAYFERSSRYLNGLKA